MSIYLQPDYFFRYIIHGSRQYSDILPVCCSIDNYFVPLFAGVEGAYISHEQKKAIVYNIKQDVRGVSMDVPRTVSKFVSLIHSYKPMSMRYRTFNEEGDLTLVYHIMKHFLYTVDNSDINNQVITPLYALCCGNKDIYTMNKSDPDYTKLFLLVNPVLLTPLHKFIAARVKPIIKYLTELGVNVMYTSNINDLCFRQTTFVQNFRTIDDRMAFIRTVKRRVGLYVPPEPEPVLVAPPVIEPEPVVQATPVPEEEPQVAPRMTASNPFNTISYPQPQGVTATFSEHILDHPEASEQRIPTTEEWRATAGAFEAATPRGDFSGIGENVNFGTAEPLPSEDAFIFDEHPTGDETGNAEQIVGNARSFRTRQTGRMEQYREQIRQQEREVYDNSVADPTVISAATHQRVQAGFIDRSSFPVMEVEAELIDDTEPVIIQPEVELVTEDEMDIQMAAMRAAASVTEVRTVSASTTPAPDLSILNDPSLTVSTSTNIEF